MPELEIFARKIPKILPCAYRKAFSAQHYQSSVAGYYQKQRLGFNGLVHVPKIYVLCASGNYIVHNDMICYSYYHLAASPLGEFHIATICYLEPL